MINTFKKSAFILIFILFTCSNAFSQQTATYRLGIAYANSLYSNKVQFEFTLNSGQRVVLSSTNPVVYFNRQFTAGQSFSFTQAVGQSCNLKGINQGTFSNQDIIVPVDCGTPPLSIFKLQITGIEQGETFGFADNYRRTYQYSASTTGNLGGYPIRDDYSITQTRGPRQCRMTRNQGVVPYTNVTVTADCGRISTGNPTPSPSPTVNPTTPPPKKFPEIDLVSRSTDDKSFGTFYDSSAPVIGGKDEDEGRYVAFVSYAAGLGNSSGKKRQILWRDRSSGVTKLVSIGMNNTEGNGDSFAPSISADGQSVAFESYATNLVPIDTNAVRDIFVWNAQTNVVTAVSTGAGESETNSESFDPVISGDGSLIAFSSGASNLAPGVDGISTINVYLKKVNSGQSPILISRDPKTKKGVGGSKPSISEDGSKVAFYSFASTLVADDKNNLWDIFLYDSGNPKLKRLSLTSSGTERDQGTESASRIVAPSISGDGNFVAFATTANNMVPGDTNKTQDVFVVTTFSGEVKRVSVGKGGIEGIGGDSPAGQGEKIGISYDGSFVTFSTKATNLGGSVVLKNTTNGETRAISTVENTVSRPSISRNGGYVVFGAGSRLDSRYSSSGIFARFTGITR